MKLKKFFDRDNMAVYPWYISELVSTKDIAKLARAKVKESFFIIEKYFLTGFMDVKGANLIGNFFFKKILADKRFAGKVIDKIYFYSESLERFNKKIGRLDEKKMGDKALIILYEEYIERLKILRLWGWIPVFLDGVGKNFLSDHLQKELKKFLKVRDKEKTSKYYALLSSSEKMSEVQKEELAKLELLINLGKILKVKPERLNVDRISGNKRAEGLLKVHLKKFGWLTYAYMGPAMTEKYLTRSLKDSLKRGDVSGQRRELLGHYLNIKKEKEELIKELGLPSNLIYLFKISSDLMFIKDYRKGIYQKSYLAMDKILGELAGRMGISLKEIKNLSFEEVKEAFLKNKKKFFKEKARIRAQKCCYSVKNGKIKIFEGELCEEMIKKMLPAERKSGEFKNELKGLVAYGGKAKGKVKIVLTLRDVIKVKEGDILVSSSTNPDLIMAMRRAGAIITDMGGIISHAAIVSRELKKPCVVGTKIATHVLKDGDMVEVDADEGLIKVLK